jgi:hypothetical protein
MIVALSPSVASLPLHCYVISRHGLVTSHCDDQAACLHATMLLLIVLQLWLDADIRGLQLPVPRNGYFVCVEQLWSSSGSSVIRVRV